MTTALRISIFTILVAGFYTYVGHMVPQTITYPPETTELGADLTTDELVEVGQEIVAGKGTCLGCHTIGSSDGALRFPDLGNIGSLAATRREGLDDVEYLAESLYEPMEYIVEGFQGGMPAAHKAPINLSDAEIIAVIAYLQSLGGTPTVSMDTELKYASDTPVASPSSANVADAAPREPLDGQELFDTYLCGTCHSLDTPDRLIGPSLFDIGGRMTRAEIYQAIVEPDAEIAEGYPPGVMTATLNASGFMGKVTTQELKILVDFLAERK